MSPSPHNNEQAATRAQKDFKRPPAKYQPRGLTILYEDRDILVVDKASGLLTVGNAQVKDRTAFFLLNEYVRKGNRKSRQRVFIVHRLDRDTSGVLVFARNEKAKQSLQDAWSQFQKTYAAVVHGVIPKKEGVMSSYLAESPTHRMYAVADETQGKLAKTGYRVVRESGGKSLLELDLLTGRKNQVRVHLADKGYPVVGDKKYGLKTDKGIKHLALHAAAITIRHPYSGEPMTFRAKTPAHFKLLMKGVSGGKAPGPGAACS